MQVGNVRLAPALGPCNHPTTNKSTALKEETWGTAAGKVRKTTVESWVLPRRPVLGFRGLCEASADQNRAHREGKLGKKLEALP